MKKTKANLKLFSATFF